jgi:hypothetical protein
MAAEGYLKLSEGHLIMAQAPLSKTNLHIYTANINAAIAL